MTSKKNHYLALTVRQIRIRFGKASFNTLLKIKIKIELVDGISNLNTSYMAGIDGFSLNSYNFEYVPGPPELIGLEF